MVRRRLLPAWVVFTVLALSAACAGVEVWGDGQGAGGGGRTGPVLQTDEPVLAVGFSNAAREADTYIAMGGDMVNGAFSGCTTDEWAGGRGRCWRQLRALGADPRVIWFKISHKRAGSIEALADDCLTAIELLQQEFPRLERVYVSGRTYAGWAEPGVDLSPEPYARRTWDAVDLCVDRSPIGEQGPWLWYDDWPRSYFARDGIHPSEEGAAAVARILADFFGG